MPYTIVFCGKTDRGLVRKNNEDMFDVVAEHNFAVLADGMGGHNAGEVAAELACMHLVQAMTKGAGLSPEKRDGEQLCTILSRLMRQMNRDVYQYSLDHSSCAGMGTTVCCVHFVDTHIIYGHVGDSRIYRYREGELLQLTEDHSLVNQLIRKGKLEKKDAMYSSYKNVVTRAIGLNEKIVPVVELSEVAVGDVYLMCTDGLSDYVPFEEIEGIMQAHYELTDIADALVEEANKSGGHDNTTVVLAQVQRH